MPSSGSRCFVFEKYTCFLNIFEKRYNAGVCIGIIENFVPVGKACWTLKKIQKLRMKHLLVWLPPILVILVRG